MSAFLAGLQIGCVFALGALVGWVACVVIRRETKPDTEWFEKKGE
jgi:hypothetical protein